VDAEAPVINCEGGLDTVTDTATASPATLYNNSGISMITVADDLMLQILI
jgi:hypothetical protein